VVPSDPLSSLLTDLHARSERGIHQGRVPPALLRVTAFRLLRFDARRSVCFALLIEASISERPFSRPQRLSLYGIPAAGSAILAYPFDILPNPLEIRSAFELPSSRSG
jgi:hypothetical protein